MDAANRTINDTKTKLKRLWDENPVLMIVLGIATANAGARVMKANTDRRNSKAWAREVDRRERKTK